MALCISKSIIGDQGHSWVKKIWPQGLGKKLVGQMVIINIKSHTLVLFESLDLNCSEAETCPAFFSLETKD